MRLLHRLVPRSLGSRIALILIAGLFGAQLFTSTVWFDRRQRALMDAPNRIVAVRVGDALKLLSTATDAPERALAPLQTDFFHAAAVNTPDKASGKIGIDANALRIMRRIIEEEAGPIAELRVTRADILGDDGQVAGMSALLCAREPRGRYTMFVAVPHRSGWLKVEASEGQHGAGTHCLATITDYILRIYLVRMIIIALIALLAVRIAMQPLKRMISAAEALGRNIRQPPLPTDGPEEVRQAAEAFNLMQAKLLKAMQERSHFLTSVSHDLRSPITRLRLRTETQLPAEMREPFRRDLLDMETLVNATLSFMQDGTSDEGAMPLDLFQILDALVHVLGEQGARIELIGSPGATMLGYPQSLKRCFQNLIENALRYAGSAQIEVAIEDTRLRISVRDDGPGIPPALLTQVLEPFYRVETSRAAETGGFGLGLSIAANIVKFHSGTIELRNRHSGGLIVDVVFPRLSGATS
ncbi:ATP-binding protein [Novosphingobium terrae]|uniref:ATP-binding protein n=1 Tax=Novosphingobium terrae TaxID=2726189 RepID=UPI00197D6843|nr:ATP-binding protein [Novosphingobium terrae]